MSEIGPVLRELGQVQRMVVQLDNRLSAVGQQVNQVSATQEQTRDQLTALRQEFLAFVHQAGLTANLQRAETRLGALQDQLEHEFGHHKVVRRTAVGMLQAFDIGLVSEETVNSVAEELMLQTPRYWLAPALVALAAWSGDDPRLCERAIEEAFRRSPSHTSLFFALILRRQQRPQAALRWLRHYLAALDPQALGRDFAVILEAIAHGAFGPAARDLVQETLDRWQDLLLADDAVTTAQVKRWRHAVDTYVPTGPSTGFAMLAAVSPQWSQLDHCLRSASAHEPLTASYAAMLAEEPSGSSSLEDAVDDILDRLVSEYDVDELPLHRELTAAKAVIECQGDLTRAQQITENNSAALERTLDYLTIQTESALNPGGIGVSRATQRLAVAACTNWFRTAHEGFSRDYRATLPNDVQARFDSHHNIGAKVFQLPPWTASFSRPLPELEGDLARHWDKHKEWFLTTLRYKWQVPAVVAGVILFLVLVMTMAMNPAFGFFFTAVIGGITALVIYSRHNGAQATVRNAEQVIDRAKADSLSQLRAAAAELTDWQTAFAAADRRESDVRELFDQLSRSGHASTPYERRHVSSGSAS
jgi:hypothetical protein